MQIVIDISEKLYEDIKEHGLCGYCSDREIVSKAILNGTPLPKGHGRLIDAGALYEQQRIDLSEVSPTIIEADKKE